MRTIRKAFTRPIFTHPLRTYPTLDAAADYAGVLLRHNPHSRFNIQQTRNGWVVGRVS